MKHQFGVALRKFERKHLPKTSKKVWYRFITQILLLPLAVLLSLLDRLNNFLKRTLRVKRKNKPDIVLSNIVAGFANLAFSDPAVEELAHKRAAICAVCPFAQYVNGIHTIVVDNKTKHIRGMKCGKCGCALSAKVRSQHDSCPVGKW